MTKLSVSQTKQTTTRTDSERHLTRYGIRLQSMTSVSGWLAANDLSDRENIQDPMGSYADDGQPRSMTWGTAPSAVFQLLVVLEPLEATSEIPLFPFR